MILVIESVILCAAFTLMIYFLSKEGIKNPAFRIFGIIPNILLSVTFCRTLEIDRSTRKKLRIINSMSIVPKEHFPWKIPEIHIS